MKHPLRPEAIAFALIVISAPALAYSGEGVACASLVVIDGDTIKCDGQNIRLLGGGVPFKSGVDAPEMGSRAKCEFERDLAMKAKARLKQLLLDGVPRIEDSGARDRTQSRRPLVNIYLPDGREAGQVLMSEGLAREWRPRSEATMKSAGKDLSLKRRILSCTPRDLVFVRDVAERALESLRILIQVQHSK